MRPGAIPVTPEAIKNGRLSAGKDVPDRLDGVPLGAVRDRWVGEVVFVGEVDDGVGVLGAGADALEIVEVAALRLGALELESQ